MGVRWGVLPLLVVMLLPVMLGAACSRGDDGGDSATVDMEISVTPDPPTMGSATIEVTLQDSDGNPIEGANLQVEGNMSHAGMEPVFADLTGGEGGRYATEDFAFTMGGDWIITVRGTLPDGEPVEQTFDLTGVEE